ncbi:serine/threonine-protein kinase [Mycobacterium sp. TY815]|uniref:serine/threonine-protein kinase n=1 Tax=unclassified Mycobacterium TaxID=2642494 RepID=UPI00274177F7|nr:serine/threonine-protein kinase [Mycobacterium sp. TY815]MDP7707114.1 serine/threonine-protein kinase [Mycobacterium sp. TY815]
MLFHDGDTFAGHTILSLLGSGGMGEVYLAVHPRLPRRVALKVLPHEVSNEAEFRERFNREADLAADLYHPNIVGVNDRGENDGQLWISMDHIDGTDASQMMRDSFPGGMPLEDAIPIVVAVAKALDYAHQRGLLHRDVKPSNILVTDPDEDGERRVLLSDFGIARELSEVSGLTATNVTVGTVAYAAPEQLMGAAIDGRADQYGLAATAFELLTGSPVYQHPNPVAVISQHLNDAPPKLSDRRPDLAALDPVFVKALSKSPLQRYPRCRDFASAVSKASGALKQSQESTQTAVAQPVGLTDFADAPQPVRDRTRRRRRTVALAAAAVAVLGIALTTNGIVQHTNTKNAADAASAPLSSAALLNGVYRIDYNLGLTTLLGSPNPNPPEQPQTETAWRAFRSTCTGRICAARSVALDRDTHSKVDPAGPTAEWQWTENHWQSMPKRLRTSHPAAKGCTTDTAQDTVVGVTTLEPQQPVSQAPAASLKVLATNTTITNECSLVGQVVQMSGTGVRISDVSADVLIPETVPAAIPMPPTPSAPGPSLTGIYRLTFDNSGNTVNGTLTPGTGTNVETWGFRSFCSPNGCVATAAAVDNDNTGEARGSAAVFHFTDNTWQGSKSVVMMPCEKVSLRAKNNPDGLTAAANTYNLHLEPNGTLVGTHIIMFTDNVCGIDGVTYGLPFIATQLTPVIPSTLMLADPTLFLN